MLLCFFRSEEGNIESSGLLTGKACCTANIMLKIEHGLLQTA